MSFASAWQAGPPKPSVRPVPALFGTRALAFTFDWLIGLAVTVAVVSALQGTFGFDLRDMAEAAGEHGWRRVDRTGLEQALAVAGGIVLGATLLGDAVGGSLGKRILGIRVARESTGGHLGLPRAALRMLGRVLSVGLCWLGYLVAMFDTTGRTWHDRIAGSVVVVA